MKTQRDLQTSRGKVIQDLYYSYDFVGNITGISQSADRYGSLGGSYTIDYYYDEQNRLIETQQSSTDIGDYNYTMTYSLSGLVGQKKCDEIDTDITFGYRSVENQLPSHRPYMAFNEFTGRTLMLWDANGQMTNMIQADTEGFRHHLWDEAGQLAGVIGNEYCGYYGYDGDGERVFKLTGTTSGSQYNASNMYLDLYFDDVVMFVSPYMVVTPKGYTKHYYNGSQRIAARLGDYWTNDTSIYYGYSLLDSACVAMEKQLYIDEPIEEVFNDELLQSIDGEELSSEPFVLGIYNMMYYMPTDMLADVLYGQKRLADDMWGVEEGVYFYHPDHLGSSSWITDDQGHATQYIHYMPYGEIWKDRQESAYSERFKFTGKERDTETGYDYFGARYYLSLLGIWLSPDPLANKYPNISPYAYCGWNPIKYVDPSGKYFVFAQGTTSQQKNDFYKAIRYLDANNCGGRYGQLSQSNERYVISINNKGRTNYNSNTKTINWDSTMGISTDNGVVLSPSTALNHEMTHATRHENAIKRYYETYKTDPERARQEYEEYVSSLQKDPNNVYDSAEEEAVIKGIEQRTALRLGEIKEGGTTRQNHKGHKVRVKDPTSTIPIEPKIE